MLLLDSETLAELGLAPGALKENITTAGVHLAALAPGSRLRVGEALLEVTKECTPCSEMDKLRPGLQNELQGRRGMLARVVEGGLIRVGDTLTLLAR